MLCAVNAIVTLIRTPVAAMCCVLILAIAWPIEIVTGLFAMPFQAIGMSRDQFRSTYRNWPRYAFNTMLNIIDWAINRKSHSPLRKGFGSFIAAIVGL